MNGQRMRECRKRLGMTLQALSEQTGVTVGFLSQLERNMNTPSITTLRSIAKALKCPEMWLLQAEGEDRVGNMSQHQSFRHILRQSRYKVAKNERIKINMPENKTDYEIFTPASVGEEIPARMTGMIIRIKPNEQVSERAIYHDDYDESILLLKGRLQIFLDDYDFILEEGDSAYIPANTMHNFVNIGDVEVEAVVFFSQLVF